MLQGMAIFPPSVPNYTDQLFDNFMNYGYGFLLVPIALLALFFNGFVFRMCFNQLNTSHVILLVLSGSDFLFTAVRAPSVAYTLLNPNVKALVPNRKPNVSQSVPSALACIAAYTSISATFGLSIMRFIRLCYPTWAVAHGKTVKILALAPMVMTIMYSFAVEIFLLLHNPWFEVFWSNTLQDIIPDNDKFLHRFLYIKTCTVLIPVTLSCILTIATAVKLYISSQDQQSSPAHRYGMVTILLLSFGNILWTCQWFSVLLGRDYIYYDPEGSVKVTGSLLFTFYVMVPNVIALYNPMVLSLRSNRMRVCLKQLFVRNNNSQLYVS